VISVLIFVFLFIGILQQVSAAPDLVQVLKDAGNTISGVLTPIAETLLNKKADSGDLFSSDTLLLYFLFFVLLSIIVWTVLDTMPIFYTHNGITGIVSAIVAIISIRFLDETWIRSMVLPYSAMGVAILSLIPLTVYIIWVEKVFRSPSFKRAAFMVGAVVFFGLWVFRSGDPQLGNAVWTYLIGMVVLLLMMIFSPLIDRFQHKIAGEAMHSRLADQSERHILNEFSLLENARNHGMSDSEYNRQRADLERRMAEINRHRSQATG